MYIPDLFGAYMKGRELAIDKNWQDLKNFEAIEDARNQNDLTAMDVWERQQQMPGKMNMFDNNVKISQMNTDVAKEAHPGLMVRARMGSGHAQDQFDTWTRYRDYGRNVMGSMYKSNLAMQDAAAQNKAGQANHWLTNNRAYVQGGREAKQAEDTQLGNSIIASHYPTVATQTNQQGDATFRNNMAGLDLGYTQIKNAQELAPYQHTLNKTNLSNQQSDANNYLTRQEEVRSAQAQQQAFDQARLMAEYMNSQDPGSGDMWLMQFLGMGGQTTPTAEQTPNSVPVGTNTVLAPTGTSQTTQPAIPQIRSLADVRALLPIPDEYKISGQSYNYPVSPEHGVYRPLVPSIHDPIKNSYGVPSSIFYSVPQY